MNIWVFNTPEKVDFVYKSILEGKSRFGWSYIEKANLEIAKNTSWENKSKEKKSCWKQSNFLLNVEKGDWIVHKNVPRYGQCTAVKVLEPYKFVNDGVKCDWGIDFRHSFVVDTNSIITFDRNDPNVLPVISARLKLQGRYWRIYLIEEFEKSIENLKEKRVDNCETSKNLFHLKESIISPLENITELIHNNYPGKDLEKLIAEVFRKIPMVLDVKENGSGWGTDFGADLIVTYNTGIPVLGLEKEEKLIVQVKSYEGIHNETNAVEQIKTGIEKFKGNAGLLITTAKASKHLEESIEQLSLEIDKPVSIISGANVAKLILKHFPEELGLKEK